MTQQFHLTTPRYGEDEIFTCHLLNPDNKIVAVLVRGQYSAQGNIYPHEEMSDEELCSIVFAFNRALRFLNKHSAIEAFHAFSHDGASVLESATLPVPSAKALREHN